MTDTELFELVTEDLVAKLADLIATADGWPHGTTLLSNTRTNRYIKSAQVMLKALAEDGYLNLDVIYGD